MLCHKIMSPASPLPSLKFGEQFVLLVQSFYDSHKLCPCLLSKLCIWSPRQIVKSLIRRHSFFFFFPLALQSHSVSGENTVECVCFSKISSSSSSRIKRCDSSGVLVFAVSLRLTVGLSSRAVGVAEGQQSRLHQLREENILPDQNKLSVLLSSLTSVCLNPSIRLLHNTEDWNHQTCGEGRGENNKRILLMSGFYCRWSQHSLSLIDSTHVDCIYCGYSL